MSDDDDEARQFENKRQRLSKDQQTYGVFYEAYEEERPSFGGAPMGNRHSSARSSGKMINFKAGEMINPNQKEVLIDVPKKKKKVTFDKKETVHRFEAEEQPKTFTMQSFLNSINAEQQEEEEEQDKQSEESKESEKVRPKKLEEHIKQRLKLYKYSEYGRAKTMKDYGLPESFGKQATQAPPKPKKTAEQVDLEHQFREKYGMGYKMLAKMGFVAGGGLGKDGSGRTAPVEAVFQTALLAEDKQEPNRARQPIVVPDDKNSSDEETKAPLEKGVEELFEYFSQNAEVNSLLKFLKGEYERLSTLIDRQQTEQERIQSKLESFESSLIQNESERKRLTQSLDELSDIRQNLLDCEKYPQHALKFNIDLLLVKMTMEKLAFASFEVLHNEREQTVGELFGLRDKLTRLYLQKERENIRNFSQDNELTKLLFEKVIDVERFEQQAELSDEDILKIRRFLRTVLQDCIVEPWLLPKIKDWQLANHTATEQVINLCEAVGKIDKEVLQESLDKYVVPALNRYLCSFQLGSGLLPHLVVFPWLTVVKPDKLDHQGMMMHLQSLSWQPTEQSMLNCVRPWQDFVGGQLWYDFISFTLAPRLLRMMETFEVSASHSERSNLAKLKGLIWYSPLLEVDHLEAILEDTLIKQLTKTYRSLRQKEPADVAQKWIEGWRRTLNSISCHPRVHKLFDLVQAPSSSD